MPAALMSSEEKANTVAYVLDALSEGRLLAEIADEMGIKRPTLFAYCHETKDLSDAYARAREEGLHVRGERLRALTREEMPRLPSGGIDSAAVAQLRIQVDAEKWVLGKLLPHVYGDKIMAEHTGKDGAPLMPTVAALTPEQLRVLAAIPLPNAAEPDNA